MNNTIVELERVGRVCCIASEGMTEERRMIAVGAWVKDGGLKKWRGAMDLLRTAGGCQDKLLAYIRYYDWFRRVGKQQCAFCIYIVSGCDICPLYQGEHCHPAWDQIYAAAKADNEEEFVEVFEKQVPIMYAAIEAVAVEVKAKEVGMA